MENLYPHANGNHNHNTPPAEPPSQAAEELANSSAQREATAENARAKGWPLWTVAYLGAMRQVPDKSLAAERAGVARTTPWRLAQKDEDFARAEDEARDVALDRLERLMYQRGSVGRPIEKTVTTQHPDGTVTTVTTRETQVSDVLAIFYLKRWRPEYRDTYRVEQTGADGGPIRYEVERKLNEAADRLDAEVVRLADARAARDAAAG